MKDVFVLSAYTTKFQVPLYLIPISMVTGIIINFMFGNMFVSWAFFGLLMMDTITGIIASVKRGEALSSQRLRDMFFKWTAYGIVILIGAGLDILAGTTWIHTASLGWVIFSEAISILENCECILGKKIPFLGKIKRVFDAIKDTGTEVAK